MPRDEFRMQRRSWLKLLGVTMAVPAAVLVPESKPVPPAMSPAMSPSVGVPMMPGRCLYAAVANGSLVLPPGATLLQLDVSNRGRLPALVRLRAADSTSPIMETAIGLGGWATLRVAPDHRRYYRSASGLLLEATTAEVDVSAVWEEEPAYAA